MPGLTDELRDQFERLFLKNVDNEAVLSLGILEANNPQQIWSSDERSAWSRFILSLLNRMPEDVAAMKTFSELSMTGPGSEFDKRYAAARQDSDPETWKEWLERKDPYLAGNLGFQLLMRVMNHEKIGRDLNNLNWFVVETPKAEYEFLTSDRPIVTHDLGNAKGYLYMPIGPRRLFVAIREGQTNKRLGRKEQDRITTHVNKTVVAGASEFVYGTNERQLIFIQKHMGTLQRERWISRLVKEKSK